MTNSRPQDIAHDWWTGLRDPSGRHRAALARMRRSHTPVDVIQEPEALRLIARLRPFHLNDDRVAALAGVLALVRENEETRVARAVGRRSLDDAQSAQLSEGRFRRLMQTEGDDLMGQMRRLVHMTKGRANVRDLSDAILYWGDHIRKRWTFEYYAVASPALPPSPDRTEQHNQGATNG